MLGTLLWSIPAHASEESQRLVARGQAAYDRGAYAEAQAVFEQAVAADPTDAEAQYGLGLALGRLKRWDEAAAAFDRVHALEPDHGEAERGGAIARGHLRDTTVAATTKRWEVHAFAGVGYDSNVTLQAAELPGSGQNSVAFTLGIGGRYDLLTRPETLVRLEYDLYQAFYPEVSDFNFRWQRPRATLSYALHPMLWAGLQGGYNYATLGGPTYLGEPFVLPFLSLLEEEWGLTQLTYRWGYDTYFSEPFEDVRDGPNNAVGLTQTFYHGPRYLVLGFQYGSENPISTAGNDYQFHYYQGSIGVGFPLWWRTTFDLMYINRYEDYTEPNSFTDFRTTRQDDTNNLYASLERPITDHVSVQLAYYFTANPSNISEFQYNRHVVSWLVHVAY